MFHAKKQPAVRALVFVLALTALLFCAAPRAWAEDGVAVITKSPTGENVTEGEDAIFIAGADGAQGIVWMIVSPDGQTVYENTEAIEAFPGLEMSGYEGEVLTLISIPYSLNGWYVQAKFLGSGGTYTMSGMALITVKRGEVPSPNVTPHSAGAKLVVGESKTLSVAAESPNGDLIKYQWFRSYSAARNTAEPILGATGPEYIPPEEIGQVFYFVGVWCVNGRTTSAPVYTAPVAIVYSEAPPTPEPAPTPLPTPAAETADDDAQPTLRDIISDNALVVAAAILIIVTAAAVIITVLILRAMNRRLRRAETEDDEE